MVAQKRIIINTIAQGVRSVLNILLLFYATRVILKTLGEEDFGIFSVIASIVSLLAFVTNALITTTQRYLSVVQGGNDIGKSKNVFTNSLWIHTFIGIIVLISLEIVGKYVIYDFLNIPTVRIEASYILYQFITLIIVLTLIVSPFRALIVAHENIVYISIIEIIDSIGKLFAAYAIIFVPIDNLITYGILLFLIQIFNLITIGGYAFYKYEECVLFDFKRINKHEILDQIGFAGWTVYNIGCVYGRMQGIAFLINKFLGPIINTSYGLAFQVSSGLQAVSQALLNAMNPQLMRAEGEGNHEKMFLFAEIESKCTFLILASLAVPVIYEMPHLLKIWLGNIPEYTVMLCRMVVFASLCDMTTIGLGSANQACGKIRRYTLVIYTTKLLTLAVAFFIFYNRLSFEYIAYTYVGLEMVSAILRITVSRKDIGLNINRFFNRVILRIIAPTAILCLCCYIICIINHPFRFLITFTLPNILFFITIYMFGLCKDEKAMIDNYMHKYLLRRK